MDVNLWECGDQQILLVAFAEMVNGMRNWTSDSDSAHKSTPGSGNETVINHLADCHIWR